MTSTPQMMMMVPSSIVILSSMRRRRAKRTRRRRDAAKHLLLCLSLSLSSSSSSWWWWWCLNLFFFFSYVSSFDYLGKDYPKEEPHKVYTTKRKKKTWAFCVAQHTLIISIFLSFLAKRSSRKVFHHVEKSFFCKVL